MGVWAQRLRPGLLRDRHSFPTRWGMEPGSRSDPGRMGVWVQRFRRGRLRLRHLYPGLSSPLPEPLDLAARVHDPLRAREERMADGADLGLQLLTRGTGREGVPARAGDDRVFVKGGVNLCLQSLTPWGSLPSERDEQTLRL